VGAPSDTRVPRQKCFLLLSEFLIRMPAGLTFERERALPGGSAEIVYSISD
jgi:hypothetical protein